MRVLDYIVSRVPDYDSMIVESISESACWIQSVRPLPVQKIKQLSIEERYLKVRDLVRHISEQAIFLK
jgi:hypothetical protein